MQPIMKTVRERQTNDKYYADAFKKDTLAPVIGWGVLLCGVGVCGVLMAQSYIVGA